MNYTYLILLVCLIAAPLALSFRKDIYFYTNWRYLFPSILITALPFVWWDLRFTQEGIWSFNPEYLTGISRKGLPLEEWLSFLVIPYSAVYLYEIFKYYCARYEYANPFVIVSLVLIVVFGAMAWVFRARYYTFYVFLFSAVYLCYTIFRNLFKQHLTKFYFTFFAMLFPYLVFSGILTGLKVVEYQPDQILGVKLFSVPVENVVYLFLMILMVTTVYEYLKERKFF